MYTVTTQINYKELMELKQAAEKEIGFIHELKNKVDWFYFLHSNSKYQPYAPTRCLSSDISLYNTLYDKPFYILVFEEKFYYKNPIIDISYVSFDWSPKLGLLDEFYNTRTLKDCALTNKDAPKDIRIPSLDRLLSIEKKEELIETIGKTKLKDKGVIEIKVTKENYEISYPLA